MLRSMAKTLVMMTVFVLLVPVWAQARPVHFFDCSNCHKANVSPSTLTTNLCLECHSTADPDTMDMNDDPLNPGTPLVGTVDPEKKMHVGDASNLYGNNPFAAGNFMHNFAAPIANVAAGAELPVNRYFYGRRNYSGNYIACSKCHDPHGTFETNPTLFKLPPDKINPLTGTNYVPNDMCLDCHRSIAANPSHGINSHMVSDPTDPSTSYTAIQAANPTKYKALPDNGASNGTILLESGNITCNSCHSVHFGDSDSGTVDGLRSEMSLNGGDGGDGVLLRHSGLTDENPDDSLCATCHIYSKHGDGFGVKVGCQTCHGGHDSDEADPNVFMLRKQITVDTSNIKAGGGLETINFNYNATAAASGTYDAGMGNGSACSVCHDFPPGHQITDDCASCHNHGEDDGQGGVTDSFSVSCGDCHGFPPSLALPGDTNPGGYAKSVTTPANDYSTSGHYKNETTTPHVSHAGGSGNYAFTCQDCHGVDSRNTTGPDHDAGTMRQVLDTAIGGMTDLATNTGALSPVYNEAGAGSCSTVYCHSNGAPRGGSMVYPGTAPVWDGGKDDIMALAGSSRCVVCHGNDAASMTTKGNSAVHQNHLGNGTLGISVTIGCADCHNATASSSTALVASAIGGEHVDGVKDVVFDTAGLAGNNGSIGYDGASGGNTGVCSNVYCHSDGKGNFASPDWDGGAVSCTSCHNNGTDNGVLDNAAPNSGAHSAHIGSNIAIDCSTCHGVNDGSHAGHLDGSITVPSSAICDSCHSRNGVDNTALTADDVTWANGFTLGCKDCHDNSKTGIASNLEPTSGLHTAATALTHDDTLQSGNCINCHDSTTPSAAHISGGAKQNSTQTAFTFAAGVTYDNTNYASTDTSCAASCHSDGGDWDRRWVGVQDDTPDNTMNPGNAVCQNCHGDFSGWRGMNVSHTDPYLVNVGDRMSEHSECQTCHGWGNANYDETWSTGQHGDGFITMNGPSPTTGAQYDDATGGCTAACHTAAFVMDTNSGWTANFIDGGSGACDTCHTTNSVNHGNASENATVHDNHNLSAYIDLNSNFDNATISTWDNCDTCHPHNGEFIASHDNGTVDFDGTNISTTYNYAKGASFGGTCGATNGCHDSDAGEWAANNLGNAADNACEDCHASTAGFFGDLTVNWPVASNAHTPHVDNNSGVPNDCNDCHGAGATTGAQAGHKANDGITLASQITAPLAANDSCTNNCHVTADNRDWVVGSLNCSDCHNSGLSLDGGGEADLSASIGPNLGKHDEHMTNAYITACNECHTHDGALGNYLTTGHVNGSNTTGSAITGGGANCTNTCHSLDGLDNVGANADDPAWADADTDKPGCVDCHDNAKTGLAAGLAPTTGLHTASAAQVHDGTLGGGNCINCHQVTPTSKHMDTTGPEAWDNGATITYNFNGTNIVGYAQDGDYTGCAANCHGDAAANSSVGKWYRRWIGVTDAKPTGTDSPGDPVCNNCHNDGIDSDAGGSDAADGWNAGVTPGHGDVDGNNGIEMIAQHGQCKTCHGWGDAGYNGNWGVDHGDGNIRMNGPDSNPGPAAGAEYDEDAWGCLMACHQGANNTGHFMADSTWPVDYADYGSGDCATCHDAELTTAHTSGSESVDTHDLHTGSTLLAGDCTQCHPHDGISVAPSTGQHWNGQVDFANKMGTSNYVGDWGTSCGTNTCHDSDGVTEWTNTSLNFVGTDACSDCHDTTKTGMGWNTLDDDVSPTGGAHGLHLANTSKVSDCATCHGHNGLLSSTAPFTNHINGGVDADGTNMVSPVDSCTNNCHDLNGTDGVGGVDATWAGAVTLGCNDCHNKGSNTLGTPVHADLSVTAAPATGKHSQHMAGDQDYMGTQKCVTCHSHEGAIGASGRAANHVTGAVTYSGNTDYVPGDQTCTNSCHTVVNGRDWTAGTLDCTDCHTSGGTLGAAGDVSMSSTVAPASGKHAAHMGNSTQVADCTSCHTHTGALTGGGNGHVNGPANTDIEVANDITVSPIPADDTCTNNCHTVVDGRDWTAGTLNCTDCHTSGLSLDGGGESDISTSIGPNAGEHDAHMASQAANTCTICHGHEGTLGNVGTTNHVDGSKTVSGQITDGSNLSVNGTCANNCHSVVDGRDWTSATTLNCGDCHGSGKSYDGGGETDLTTSVGPNAGKHDEHMGNSYIGTCSECHPHDGALGSYATTSHVDGVGPETSNKITSGGATCTNTCHVLTNGVDNKPTGADAPTWAGANGLGCNDCHTTGKTGLYDNGTTQQEPESGLHTASVALAHNNDFDTDKTCTSCHLSTPTDAHMTAGASLPQAFGGAAAYNFNATNIDGYSSAGCAANCHTDVAGNVISNPGKGKWFRKWIGVVDDKPVGASAVPGNAVCDNCHGDGIDSDGGGPDQADVWRSGIIGHVDSPDADGAIEMISQHSQCKTCHGWDDAGTDYDETWLSGDHGNGTLSINGPDAAHGAPAGAQYDEENFGCLAACHTGSLTNSGDANFNHTMADSEWTLAYGDFGSGNCSECHDTELSTAHTSGSESLDTHNLHTTSNVLSGNCTHCHPHDGISDAPGSGGDHQNGFIDFADKMGVSQTATDWGAGCASNTCHDSDGVAEWTNTSLNNVGGDACSDCHDTAKTGLGWNTLEDDVTPTSGAHALHLANTNKISDCATCHGHNGLLSSVDPFTNHINNGTDADGTNLVTAVDSCTNNCHDLNGTDGVGGVDATWAGAATLGCNDCHNKGSNTIGTPVHANLAVDAAPATGKHAKHMAADADYLGASKCVTCHSHEGEIGATGRAANHVTGAITYSGNTDYSAQSCTNSCHVVTSAADDGWVDDARTLECTDCHTTAKTLGAAGDGSMSGTVAPATGQHTNHMNNTVYAGDCTDCHNHAGALTGGSNGHVNGPAITDIQVAGQITVSPIPANDTCTNNCHTTADGRDWTVGTLNCTDCHDAGGNLDAGGTFSGTEPTTNKHGIHIANTNYAGDCTDCHAHAGALAQGGNGHVNGPTVSDIGLANQITPGSYAGDDTCTNSCHNNVDTRDWAGGTLLCNDCHTGSWIGGAYAASGQHSVHNSTQAAAYTSGAVNNSTAGNYDFSCANCHGNTGTNHMNGGGITVTLGDYSAGNCNNNSCHQDGSAGAAAVTANWTSGWVADGTPADTCDNCHGNAPGTGAHSVHAIGIHAEDIYDLTNGGVETFPAAEAGDPHGDAAYATTINCSTCHFTTTTDWFNANDSRCASCHDTSNTNLGDNAITIADKSLHVNGSKNVAFMNINFKAKAQLRDDITSVTSVNSNWTRNNGYKSDTSFDQANSNLNVDSYADVTCTNACHIGNDVNWAVPTGDCSKCHTELPQ